jgi:hypothetical protein
MIYIPSFIRGIDMGIHRQQCDLITLQLPVFNRIALPGTNVRIYNSIAVAKIGISFSE